MARQSLRERWFTAPVARAMRAPGALLLGAAGGAVALLVGLPAVAAPVAALLAWGARVAASVPRGHPTPPIDPFALDEPWRRYVVDALEARARYAQVVTSAVEGPLKERLGRIGHQVDAGVEACWRLAERAQQLDDARGDVALGTAGDGPAEPRAERAPPPRRGPGPDEVADAARSRPDSPPVEHSHRDPDGDEVAGASRSSLEAARRADALLVEVDRRLRVTDARLDEAASRALELVAETGTEAGLTGLDDDVGGVVAELEALRRAVEEAGGVPGSRAAGPPGAA